MTDDETEIEWHKEQIEKNRDLLEELEAGNTAGAMSFPKPNRRSTGSRPRSLNPS
jgi:hypothetical protein